MYPQLFNQASRLAPHLQRLMQGGARNAFSIPGKFMQIDIPEPDGPAQPVRGPAPPISGDNSGDPKYSAGASPLDRLKAAFSQFGNPTEPVMADNQPSPLDTAQWPAGPEGGPSPLDNAQWPFGPMGAAEASVAPLPRSRPAEAPQAPEDTGFFRRNAMMMQDPMGGGFIDPTGAASVSGPDLISKMMGYLNRKV
jgi:hypothetical protein